MELQASQILPAVISTSIPVGVSQVVYGKLGWRIRWRDRFWIAIGLELHWNFISYRIAWQEEAWTIHESGERSVSLRYYSLPVSPTRRQCLISPAFCSPLESSSAQWYPLHCIETFHTASTGQKAKTLSVLVPYVYVRQFDPTFLWKHERST